jgi:hypothetical protein
MARIGGKGMSYIVKNCSAILRMTKICDAYETTRDLPQFCKDCTDCIIKRVIDKCKEETKLIRIYEDKDKGTAIAEYSLNKDFAQEILAEFDIEEVEE